MRSETETLPMGLQERFAEQARYLFPVAVVRSRCVRTLACIAIVAGCLGQSCSSVPPLADSDQLDEQVAGYQPDDPAAEPDGGISDGNDEPATPYIPPVIVDPPSVEPPVVDPPIVDPPVVDPPLVDPPTEPEPDLVFEIAASKVKGPAPLDVDFSPLMANNEPLPEGWYYWDFGDGSTAEGPYVNHVFQSAGTYTVALCIAIGSATGCSENEAARAAVAGTKNGKAERTVEATRPNTKPLTPLDVTESTPIGTTKLITLVPDRNSPEGLTFVIQSLPSAGTLTDPDTNYVIQPSDMSNEAGGPNGYVLQPSGRSVLYTPTVAGTYSFTYAVHDGANSSSHATVTVAVSAEPRGTLEISPIGGFSASGFAGGPFSPANATYTIRNTGTAEFAWSASTTQAWLSVSPNGGVLKPGEPPLNVVATIAPDANSLPVGTYGGTVRFENLDYHEGDSTRPGSLGIHGVTPDEGFQASGPAGTAISASKSYTLKNNGTQVLRWGAAGNQSWLTLTPSSGQLAAGASTTLTVQLTADTASLPAGSHAAAWTVTNTESGLSSRGLPVNLTLSGSEALPMTTASRTTGVAPLAVFFDAVNTTLPPWTSGVVQPPPSLPEKTVDSQPVNITGATVTWVSGGTPNGNGTLAFSKASNSLTWAAPGDAPGATVAWTNDGQKVLTSANGRTAGVKVTFASLPATDQVDAIAIGSTPIPDYAGYHYKWDFGDPGSGNWSTNGRIKNEATGYVAAHVFEQPGTYRVTLTVTDAEGDKIDYTQEITAIAFSGTTYYVSSSEGNDGNDGLSDKSPFQSITRAQAELAANTRVLLRRGDQWTSDKIITLPSNGPGIIGAYGDGTAPPLIRCTHAGNAIRFVGPDWRVMDIALSGPGAMSADFGVVGHVTGEWRNGLILRVKVSEFWAGIGVVGGDLGIKRENAIVDCRTENTTKWGVCVGGQRVAVLGTTVVNSLESHSIRVWQADKATLQANSFNNPQPGNNSHTLKLHGPKESAVATTVMTRTQYVVISDNRFSGKVWPVAIGPQDHIADERLRHVIFERNLVLATEANVQSGLQLWARFVTVRNNLFDGTDAYTHYRGVSISRRGFEPPSAGVRVLNNTIYRGDMASTLSGVIVGVEADDVVVRNNLVSGPNTLTKMAVEGECSRLIEDHNLQADSAEFVDPGHEDFRLKESLKKFMAGEALPSVRDDYMGFDRPVTGTTETGACER